MGDIIQNQRFPKPRTERQRELLRQKFARRPLSRTKRIVKHLPDEVRWRR